MADIRINALATTAASTASDDYIAIDGSANGTRKLNAYSPTFGGDLTVSGQNAYVGVGGTGAADAALRLNGSSATNQGAFVNFSRNSVVKGYLGTSSAVLGGSSDDMILYGTGSSKIYSGSAVSATFDGSQNTTLAGNLTVSGTGTSSFAGKVQSIVPSATGYNQLYDTSGITTGRGAFAITSTGAGLAFGIEASAGGTSFAGSAAYSSYIGTTTATPFYLIYNSTIGATLTSGGNLLLGTTTDSSSGKLQLASSTSNSGGIGFGSDVTVFRSGNKTLNIETSAHTTYVAFAPESSIWMQQNYASGFDSVLRLTRATVADWDFVAGTDLVIKRNNTTALTLDSSQNATFAGNILAGTTTSVARTTVLSANSATTNDLVFTYNAAGSYRNGIGNNFNSVLPGYNEMAFLVNAGVDTTTQNKVLSLYGDKSATFAGAVRSNAQEGFKIAAASGYFAGYEADGTTLNGYLQFINSTGTLLNQSIAGKNIALAIAGTPQLTLTTGNATFAGGIIGMTQGNVDNISDDGVASFTPLYNRGFIVINNPDYSQNALIAYFKAGSSYLLYSITKSADVTLNNSTTLTGTTGTDGKLNIGYNNSIIYIENRLGGIGNFQRYALGGTNN